MSVKPFDLSSLVRPNDCSFNDVPDFKLVSDFLFRGSANFDFLGEETRIRLFVMGDGNGKMTKDEMVAKGTTFDWWDWTHIRDSSDEAITAIAAEIRFVIARAIAFSEVDNLFEQERELIDKLKDTQERRSRWCALLVSLYHDKDPKLVESCLLV